MVMRNGSCGNTIVMEGPSHLLAELGQDLSRVSLKDDNLVGHRRILKISYSTGSGVSGQAMAEFRPSTRSYCLRCGGGDVVATAV